MTTTGANLGLLGGGTQGEQHYTEMVRTLRGYDGLIMPGVIDKDLATPPGSPTDGQRYIVASSPTGAWAGQAGKIARYTSVTPGWEFFTPKKGWCLHVDDENAWYRHTGTAWEIFVGAKSTGWTAATGTATRTTFDTATVTLPQLAEHVKALIDDLIAQNRIGT